MLCPVILEFPILRSRNGQIVNELEPCDCACQNIILTHHTVLVRRITEIATTKSLGLTILQVSLSRHILHGQDGSACKEVHSQLHRSVLSVPDMPGKLEQLVFAKVLVRCRLEIRSTLHSTVTDI